MSHTKMKTRPRDYKRTKQAKRQTIARKAARHAKRQIITGKGI